MANLIISGDAGSGRVAEVTTPGTSTIDRVSKPSVDGAILAVKMTASVRPNAEIDFRAP